LFAIADPKHISEDQAGPTSHNLFGLPALPKF